MSSNGIKILGRVLSAGEQILTVAAANGGSKALPLAEAAGAVVVAAASDDAADRVMAVASHLAGRGSLRDALAAHCPNLPAAQLALVLGLVDGLTESMSNDGRISASEVLALVADLARELPQ